MTVNSRIAFFDAEFTANTAKDRGLQEIIQCALFIFTAVLDDENETIVRIDDTPLLTYTSFVKPNYTHNLSQYIKKLTHIKQQDVENAKSAACVFEELLNLCKDYGVNTIYTWGPDKAIIKNNCSIINIDRTISNELCSYFSDLSQFVSNHLGHQKILSQHQACKALNVTEDGHNHNAYSDASNLSKLTKKILLEVPIPIENERK